MARDVVADFGAVLDDFRFFLAHSNETEAQLRTYGAELADLGTGDDPIGMLDFGCGTGEFTAHFIAHMGWPPERLRLSLVDPNEEQRRQAADRLAPLSAKPIAHWPALPDPPPGPIDLVLANHVFYYVGDLAGAVTELLASLEPGGRLLAGINGQANPLTRISQAAFALAGEAYPHHLSEDLAAALAELGVTSRQDAVAYRVDVPDSSENRAKLLRFHLADRRIDPYDPALLALFEPYALGGLIALDSACDHYVIQAAK